MNGFEERPRVALPLLVGELGARGVDSVVHPAVVRRQGLRVLNRIHSSRRGAMSSSMTAYTTPATGSRLAMYSGRVMPLSHSTTVNSQLRSKPSATQPTATSLAG